MVVNGVGSEKSVQQYTTELNIQKESTSKNAQVVMNDSNVLKVNNQATSKQVGKEKEEEIVNTIKEINKVLDKVDVGIKYEKHEATNRMMIRLINKENNEVIKELPSEKILDMAASMCEQAGLFVDERL